MSIGIAFEHWITDLYKDLGKTRVRHNILKKKQDTHSQFDVVYGILPKYYVECKYKSQDYTTPLSEVATFAAKLHLFNIPYKRGIMITNQDFDSRSYLYAKKTGLQLINKEKLTRMHKERLSLLSLFRKIDLEEVLHKDLNCQRE